MTFRRFRTAIQRRVGYRVTLGGALFALALALTGAAAFLSANNLLFLIFSAMLALLLVSGFLSRLVLAGLELELLLPEHVCALVPGPARVRVRNLKRLTPSFSIELEGRRDSVGNLPSILARPVYFPLIPGGGVVEAGIEVTFPRRGRHRENVFVLSTRFPFGFLLKTTTVALRRETIVYPSLASDPDAESLLRDIAGEVETRFRGTGLDFYRIRPYETTDSARLVDWKSTAHTGTLQVREFSRDERRTVEIFLDRRLPRARTEFGTAWFERTVARCAFLAWHLTERETGVWLRSQRWALAVPEEGGVYDLLRYLALVEPLTGGAIDDADLTGDPSNVRVVLSAQPAEFEARGWGLG